MSSEGDQYIYSLVKGYFKKLIWVEVLQYLLNTPAGPGIPMGAVILAKIGTLSVRHNAFNLLTYPGATATIHHRALDNGNSYMSSGHQRRKFSQMLLTDKIFTK